MLKFIEGIKNEAPVQSPYIVRHFNQHPRERGHINLKYSVHFTAERTSAKDSRHLLWIQSGEMSRAT